MYQKSCALVVVIFPFPTKINLITLLFTYFLLSISVSILHLSPCNKVDKGLGPKHDQSGIDFLVKNSQFFNPFL